MVRRLIVSFSSSTVSFRFCSSHHTRWGKEGEGWLWADDLDIDLEEEDEEEEVSQTEKVGGYVLLHHLRRRRAEGKTFREWSENLIRDGRAAAALRAEEELEEMQVEEEELEEMQEVEEVEEEEEEPEQMEEMVKRGGNRPTPQHSSC